MGHPVRQLDLRGVREQYATVITGKRGSILALGAATDAGARLELRAVTVESPEPEELRVDLDLRGTPRITVTESGREPRTGSMWSMVCSPALDHRDDVMGSVLAWARAKVDPRLTRRQARTFVHVRDVMQPLRELIAEVASAALDRCDQPALQLALTFTPLLRLAVYTRLVADQTGRLAELVEVCPGALVFALALIERHPSHRTGPAGERLLADVIAGRRLNHAIDEATDAWLDAHATSVAASAAYARRGRRRRNVGVQGALTRPTFAAMRPEDAWAVRLASESRESLRVKQRISVRRAGPEVSTCALWQLPPLVLTPEDIPRDERDNSRWYRVMRSNAFTLQRVAGIDPRWQDAVCRFLSRHAARLAREEDEFIGVPLTWLLGYAHAESRWLDRDTDPARVYAELSRARLVRQQQADHAKLLAVLAQRGISPRHPLVAPLFDVRLTSSPGVELAPITTVDELFAEARALGHCVAQHVFDALAGRALVFQGVVHGERVTVELAHGGRRPFTPWVLRDARRAHNQAPGPAAAAAIRAWAARSIALQELGERTAATRLATLAPDDCL